MRGVYNWMAVGLALTGVVAMATVSSETLSRMVLGNRIVFMILVIGELGLVIGLSAAINRMSAATAVALFCVYAAVNGLTLSVIFIIYTAESIAGTFFITAGTFGAMSLFGYVTKRDLTGMGHFMLMGLIGIIIASIVNIFLNSQGVYWFVTYAGVLIFTGLTAYDTQKIKRIGMSVSGGEQTRKGTIIGALTLYLDFINLFLMLLRIFGKRR
jgi:FtsH-binding integral membrane protein